MADLDAFMQAALGAPVVRPPFLAYLDILGDPVRATTWETSITLTDTGDGDLDNQLFTAISPQFTDIGAVKRQTGGSDTVSATLSGIVGPDSDLLNLLGDDTKWKGRLVRLWFILLDETGAQIGGVAPYYTGRMVSFAIKGSPNAQTAEVTIESYLASMNSASNRTYLDQADFDPNDKSASLTIASANGAKAGGAGAVSGTGSAVDIGGLYSLASPF